MASSPNVKLELLVEAKKALSELEKFEKNAAGSLKKVESGFDSMKKVAAAAVAVFAAKQVVDFFAAGVDAAVKQEDAMRRLNTALELTGEASDAALGAFAEFANEMEASTRFGDDVIVSQLAIAKSFGVSNEAAQELVKAAADLATATGVTLDTAVDQLGKTYSGSTGLLGKQLPILKELTAEQLKNGEAVRIIAERYGGSAQADIQTFSGALLQAQNAFGNFQEAIGSVLVNNESVVAAMGLVRDTFAALEGVVGESSGALDGFVTFMAKGFAVSLSVGVEIVGFLARALEGLVSVGGLAFGGLLEIAATFVTAWRETIGRAVEVILGFAETVARSIKTIPGLGFALDKMGIKTDAAADGIQGLREAFARTADTAVADVADLRDGVIEGTVAMVEKFEGFNQGFDTFQQKIDESAAKVFEADGKLIDSAKKVADGRAKALGTSTDLSSPAEADLDPTTEKGKTKAAKSGRDPNDQSVDPYVRGAGVLAAGIAQGAEGAKTVVVEGMAAGLDAVFGPGIGQAAKPLLDLFAQGPEQTKAMVRAFVDALPDVIIAIAEAAPVFVEALLDSLINRGGAVKIAKAITVGMAEASWKAVGKALGVEVGQALNGDEIGKKIGSGMKDAVAQVGKLTSDNIVHGFQAGSRALLIDLPAKLSKFAFVDFPGALRSGAVQLGNGIKQAIAAVPGLLTGFFTVTVPNAFRVGIEAPLVAFQNFLTTTLPGVFTAGGDAIAAGAKEEIDNLIGGVKEALAGVLGPLQTAVDSFGTAPAWLTDLTDDLFNFTSVLPSWLQKFEELVARLTNWEIPGTGGGGGPGLPFSHEPTADDPLGIGYAKGITEVPGGYPNDTFAARLTSGERVVDADTNSDLKDFLATARAGQPIVIVNELKLDGRVLAKSMKDLNYKNARTA